MKYLKTRCKPLYYYIFFLVASEIITRLLVTQTEYNAIFDIPIRMNMFQSIIMMLLTLGSIFIFCYINYCKVAKYLSYFYMVTFVFELYFILKYKYEQYKQTKTNHNKP